MPFLLTVDELPEELRFAKSVSSFKSLPNMHFYEKRFSFHLNFGTHVVDSLLSLFNSFHTFLSVTLLFYLFFSFFCVALCNLKSALLI